MRNKERRKKAHQKSRRGCASCKRRKVKCDEVKPLCGPCEKKGVPCPYQHELQSITLLGTEVETEPEFPLAGEHCAYMARLMHHYCFNTAPSIADNPRLQKLHAYELPELAFEHPFLTSGIYLLAASHLHYLEPWQTKHVETIHHHSTILFAGLRRELHGGISQINAEITIAAVHIITIYSTTLPTGIDQPWPGIENGWFPMLREIPKIYEQAAPWIAQTMFSLYTNIWECVLDPVDEEEDDIPPEVIKLCQDSAHHKTLEGPLERLRPLLKSCKHPLHFPGVRFRWIVRLEDEFVEMLRHHDPTAIVLFAHWLASFLHYRQARFAHHMATIELTQLCRSIPLSMAKYMEFPAAVLRQL